MLYPANTKIPYCLSVAVVRKGLKLDILLA